ncbi:MAG: cytochrome C oxidase subunit IV family protein [Bacteroidetes bacterium]|nr:cytochrome C oxidase subunit IV family protein [Bacteroidota bacterium]MCZ6900437.1 cytochrome C oxidase subunit IV family protein [Bacteroidota bacterium]
MEETTEIIVQPVDKSKVRHLLKVALILFIVTIIEFVIAFTMESSPLRTSIFIGLTIVKAFYIVSEFMHLGHEAKVLIWSILIPMLFVVWLIIALLMEGNAILLVH